MITGIGMMIVGGGSDGKIVTSGGNDLIGMPKLIMIDDGIEHWMGERGGIE